MKLNDKNIDQIFRDAAQNSDAPRYDHSYWKEVNSMLNNEDKRKRGFILWSIAGSVVMALLVSSLFVLNNSESNLLLADGNSSNVNSIQNNETPNKVNSSDQSDLNQANSEKADMDEKNITQSASTINNSEKGEDITSNNTISNNTVARESLNTASLKEENDTQLHSNDNNRLENNSNQSKNIVSKDEVVTKSSDIDENYSIESLSPRMVYLNNLETNKELLPIILQKDKSLNFYAKLSAGLMENYETSRPFQSSVFDLSLNVEYQKEQVLFRTGLGIQATSNADIIVSERAKVYGFGLTTHQNNLSYQSLYDLYIPIEIGYSLNNTSFGFGGQMNYMFGTTMNYESLENNIVVDKDKLKGFNEGLNAFTAQGYVWLEQKISTRFVAGIKVGTNLNSRIKEGRYFNESATTNPLYGQLTLRYNLSK